MDAQPIPRINVLQCLIGRDVETGMYEGHCLNFDIVECGKSEDEAWGNLKEATKRYIEHCYANYPEGLSVSAAREDWERWWSLEKASARPTRYDTILLDLKPPMPKMETPIWMQGAVTDAPLARVC